MVSLILQRRETEAQRGRAICPRSHSWEGAESGSELRAMFSALNSPTPGAGPGGKAETGPRPAPTSLPHLDGPQGQHVLLVRQELLHLDEGLLALHRKLAPGLGPGQDLADRALGQPQHVVAEHPLPDVVFKQLLLHLEGDLRRVQLLLLCSSPCRGHAAPAPLCWLRTPGRLRARGWGSRGRGGLGAIESWGEH